jgi:hypothetical protein
MNKKNIVNYMKLFFPLSAVTFGLLNSPLGFYGFSEYSPRTKFWDLGGGINIMWPCFKSVGLEMFTLDAATYPDISGCRNHTYGYMAALSFGLQYILNGSEFFWGTVHILVFLLVVTKIYFLKSSSGNLFSNILGLFSPGIFLLMASGNMDLQIINMLLIASICIATNKEKTALIFIFFASLFKFYTFPVLFVVLLILKRKTSQVYGFLSALSALAIILYQMIRTPLVSFPDGAQNKFGMGILDNYIRKLGIDMSPLQGQVTGLVTLVFVFFAITHCYKKFSISGHVYLTELTKEQKILYVSFVLTASASIACYIPALNVDYRLTFVALSGMALFKLPQVRVKFVSSLFPYVWLTSLWVVFPFAGLKQYIGIDLQPLGDIAMIGTMAYFAFQLVFAIKQIRHSSFIYKD